MACVNCSCSKVFLLEDLKVREEGGENLVCHSAEVSPNDRYYTPNYEGYRKRRKLIDYAEEDTEEFRRAYSLTATAIQSGNPIPFLFSKPVCRFEKTPGLIQRSIEQAYGFTPLHHGHKLRRYTYHSLGNLPDPYLAGSLNALPDIHPAESSKPNFTVREDWHIFEFGNNDWEEFDLFNSHPHVAVEISPAPNNFTDQHRTMATSGDSTLFDESFTITGVNADKYDRVARLAATSGDSQTVMTLDINSELYPCQQGETVHCVLASSLALDGTKDDKGWRDVAGGEPTLADMFDYVCHGKIYKFEDAEDGQTIKAYVSFGGLLMALEGPYKKLTPLRVDYVYLLLKK